MADIAIGVTVQRLSEESRPALSADMSTILIVGPAAQADTYKYPLDTPVAIYSNDTRALKKLGEAGNIPDAIRGVNDQLGEADFAATIIIVRTAAGTESDANDARKTTIKNIIGSSTQGTGMWAGLRATELTTKTPRLWMAPGYTGELANVLGALDTNVRGQGYVPGQTYPVTFDNLGTGAVAPVATVTADEDGTLMDPVIQAGGAYIAAGGNPAVTATIPAPPTGGVQGTLTPDITILANPVVVNLDAVLTRYLAHAVVESAGTSETNDNDWRETINSTRIIPVSGGVRVLDPVTGSIVVRPFAPRVIGAIVRRDHETGGPFHSACNQPIRGILGPARNITFKLTDGDNEGQALLRNNLGILVRGELGDDFAITSSGFVFLGTDNAGDDELWRFYNQTRGRDYIHLMMIRTLRFYLGKFNVSAHLVQVIVNTMESILQELEAKESILGSKVGFAANDNTVEALRQGRLTVQFAAEEPAPLRRIDTKSSRYRPAVDALLQQLESQLNIAA